jgi:DeoR/GlpR family transcriptional regulator of sugar metabolism
VTEETIRRDLDRLESEGLASKTYGGAVSRYNASLELPYTIREEVHIEEKQRIAALVADLISDGERVMLDASSTALYVFRRLREKKNLTVITNSVKILLESADRTDWTVISTGGSLRTDALSLTGPIAEHTLSSYYADTAICSCKGLDTKLGVSDSTQTESPIKQTMFASAARRILCVDSDKFDKKAFVKLFDLSEVDLLVTEREPSADWRAFCESHGIRLVY